MLFIFLWTVVLPVISLSTKAGANAFLEEKKSCVLFFCMFFSLHVKVQFGLVCTLVTSASICVRFESVCVCVKHILSGREEISD